MVCVASVLLVIFCAARRTTLKRCELIQQQDDYWLGGSGATNISYSKPPTPKLKCSVSPRTYPSHKLNHYVDNDASKKCNSCYETDAQLKCPCQRQCCYSQYQTSYNTGRDKEIIQREQPQYCKACSYEFSLKVAENRSQDEAKQLCKDSAVCLNYPYVTYHANPKNSNHLRNLHNNSGRIRINSASYAERNTPKSTRKVSEKSNNSFANETSYEFRNTSKLSNLVTSDDLNLDKQTAFPLYPRIPSYLPPLPNHNAQNYTVQNSMPRKPQRHPLSAMRESRNTQSCDFPHFKSMSLRRTASIEESSSQTIVPERTEDNHSFSCTSRNSHSLNIADLMYNNNNNLCHDFTSYSKRSNSHDGRRSVSRTPPFSKRKADSVRSTRESKPKHQPLTQVLSLPQEQIYINTCSPAPNIKKAIIVSCTDTFIQNVP